MQNVQYITDVEGHKTVVILPIEDYEEMLVDWHFGKVMRKRKKQKNATKRFMLLKNGNTITFIC